VSKKSFADASSATRKLSPPPHGREASIGGNKVIVAELSKNIVSRILETTSNIPKIVLEEMSLAAQLNVLFLLRGSYGSVGDHTTTQLALRLCG